MVDQSPHDSAQPAKQATEVSCLPCVAHEVCLSQAHQKWCVTVLRDNQCCNAPLGVERRHRRWCMLRRVAGVNARYFSFACTGMATPMVARRFLPSMAEPRALVRKGGASVVHCARQCAAAWAREAVRQFLPWMAVFRALEETVESAEWCAAHGVPRTAIWDVTHGASCSSRLVHAVCNSSRYAIRCRRWLPLC